ncbi:hypothetical protein QTP88_005564 [Uroleucon formosanum]
MPNIGGPAQWKRRLLTSVVESQLLYAAPVWVPAIPEVTRTRAILICPLRSAALRVIRFYRTVSDEATLVLACMPLANLLGLERTNIRSRLRAAMEPGEQRPSKAAVKARKETLRSPPGRRDGVPPRRRHGRAVSSPTWQDGWEGLSRPPARAAGSAQMSRTRPMEIPLETVVTRECLSYVERQRHPRDSPSQPSCCTTAYFRGKMTVWHFEVFEHSKMSLTICKCL